MDALSIGQVAKQVAVGVETIRFYEREGLLDKPKRNASGYRQYSQEVISRLYFIKQAKKLGFSLNEISELLSLRVDPDTNCETVKARAIAKITNIDSKIEVLQNMRRALVKLTAACQGAGPTSECPILNFLGSQTDETGNRELDTKK